MPRDGLMPLMDTPSFPLRLARRKHYAVASRSLCLEAEDEEASRPFERIYAGWHLHPREADNAEPDVTIRVRRGSPPPLRPDGLESFETAGGWLCSAGENTYIHEGRGFSIRAGEDPRRVDVWLGDTEQTRTPLAFARLVFEATSAALRRCGLFDLHAAACVEPRSGACVLLAGPSGSGKSTLTMQLAARGWQYISDDSLLLAETDGGVEAWGVRRAFAVTKEAHAAELVPGLKDVETRAVPFDPLKLRFHPRDLFPEGFREKGAPRVLFFASLSHERESRCRELPQWEAMSRLLRMCPWACYDRAAARGYVAALAALARQCVCHELRAGTDLLGDLDYAAAYVAAHVSAGAPALSV